MGGKGGQGKRPERQCTWTAGQRTHQPASTTTQLPPQHPEPTTASHLLPAAAQGGGQAAAACHRAQLAGQCLQGRARIAGQAAGGCWQLRRWCRRPGGRERLGGGAGGQHKLGLHRCQRGGRARRCDRRAALLLQRLGGEAPAEGKASGGARRWRRRQVQASASARRALGAPRLLPSLPCSHDHSPGGSTGAGGRAGLLGGPEARG